MKLLYLCADLGVPVLGGKGASLHVRALASALQRDGNEVAVAAAALVRSPWDPPVSFGVPVTHVPPTETVDAAARAVKTFRETVGSETALAGELRRIVYNEELRVTLKRVLERTPPDVLLERASVFGTAGSLVAAELGVPHIVELHAPLASEQRAYRGGTLHELALAAERLTLSRADAVLAVSRPLADHAVRAGARRERVHVLPNAIDGGLFRPAPRDATLRRRLRLGSGPLVGFVGGLRAWHGVEALPELLALLSAGDADVRLVVAGDGPLAGRLRAELDRRGVAARATLLGALPQDDIPPLVRELDVALAPYPAPDDGGDFYFSPLKLFEYMGCGAPIVASRVGQIAEVVRDGENGVLVTPGDIDDLVRACRRLLEDAGLRARLGSAAAADAHRLHTWDRNAARVTELAMRLKEVRSAA